MHECLVIAATGHAQTDFEGNREYLRRARLFKTLSLHLADAAHVSVPPTLLMLADSPTCLHDFRARFDSALMIRVDYRVLSAGKPIGGVPVYSEITVGRVIRWLLERSYFPMLQPHIDRFIDVYSVGAAMTVEEYTAEIEIVGPGFDAGDLRLGYTTPHERITIDLATERVENRWTLPDDVYAAQRRHREQTRRRLQAYCAFVNNEGELLPSLDILNGHEACGTADLDPIADRYAPIPGALLHELVRILWRIRTEVILALPPSKVFVASLSFVPGKRWLLWDVFGEWYRR